MPRYAAIDIGSNSVRMLAAEVNAGGRPLILAEDREVTRLGESVFSSGQISRDAIERVCAVLTRMAAAYQRLNVMAVRAVATSAVRDAGNSAEFLERAAAAIGAPVEVISGQEEARLIHLGVQSLWPHPRQRIMIIDIGGGSAEIIVAQNGVMTAAFSKPLGAVRLTQVFLQSDPPREAELHRMFAYIDEKVASVARRVGKGLFDRVIGTSATAGAVVCAVNRVSQDRRDAADRFRAPTGEVRKLYEKLSGRDLGERRKIAGIGPRRAEIVVAGAAVLLRILRLFERPSVYYSAAGVRDGIIADLAARGAGAEQSRMDREQRRAVEDMARKFGVEVSHARQVADLSSTLFLSLHSLHELPAAYGKLLEAASYLHDTGHYVSDISHHKHSYYLVANYDLPGFTQAERRLIAALCRFHRKSMPAPRHEIFETLSADDRHAVLMLTPLLRLADSLDRSHEQLVESLDCQVRNGNVVLSLVSKADTDLEQWAGERVGEVFRQVYARDIVLERRSRTSKGAA